MSPGVRVTRCYREGGRRVKEVPNEAAGQSDHVAAVTNVVRHGLLTFSQMPVHDWELTAVFATPGSQVCLSTFRCVCRCVLPSIVYSGQDPDFQIKESCAKVRDCDALLIMGTSASVQPANRFIGG